MRPVHFCFPATYEVTEMDVAGETHKSYSVSFKLQVVDYAKKKSKREAARHFSINRRCIQRWCQEEDQLRTFHKEKKIKKSALRKPGGGRKVRYMDIEVKLMEWFKERREAGARVTGKSLRREALRLHKLYGNQSFKASCRWLQQFKRRHNLSFRR